MTLSLGFPKTNVMPRRIRKELGSQRVDCSQKQKKKFCRMIQQGVPFKEVTKEYKKQFGKPLSRSTYFDWKKNTEEIINSGASSGLVRTSYTLSDIRNQFDEDLLAEIEKTTQDVEGIVGLSIMAAKLAATPKYQEEDQIQSLTFHLDFCKRIIRIHNLRVTSSLSTMLVMTKSEEEAEISRLTAIMSNFDDSRIWNADEVSR